MARQMKDSGVEWIGQIPEDWNVARLCDIKSEKKFAIVDGPFGSAISTNDYREKGVPLIRISNLKNGEVSDEDMVYISEELAESVRRSCIGLSDIVFAKTGATIGKCGINRLIKYGILASSCIKISISHKYNCDYFYYIFSTDQFNQALRNTCTGTTRDTINLTPFSKLNVLLPPYCIQNRIASYLDRKCAEIDAIIAKQQHIIEKLKEYKLSVITEAVTKGLNPNVPMKDSGVEWIGKIPEHWKIIKMKFLGKTRNGLTYSPEDLRDETDGILVLRSANIQNGKLDFTDKIYVSCPVKDELMVKKGDILICSRNGSRKLIGKNVIINTDISASFGAFMMIFRTPYNSEYIRYILNSDVFSYYLGTFLTSTINQLTRNNFDNMVIPFTFNNEEQKYLVMYLKNRCDKIDELIRNKQVEIETLYKYKKSLIYEVVTGKMEV